MRYEANHLLARLPGPEVERLVRDLEPIALEPGSVVVARNGALPFVYFPTTAVCSVVVDMADGRSSGAATVGNEGLLGLPAVLGMERSLHRVVVQVPGEVLRIAVGAFQRATHTGSRLDSLVRSYLAFALHQAQQGTACNALHSIVERASRWLLMTHDRSRADEFFLTHEGLAEMLGVRRQSVSLVASALQRDGLIEYHRGHLRLLDRARLERIACECYAAMRSAYAHMLA